MKHVLIINGHSNKESYCRALSEKYLEGAKKVTQNVELVNISELEFNPVLEYEDREKRELEPDLIELQNKIKRADHLVFVYPNWWGTYPALLKGMIDKVFASGFAFKYEGNSPLPKKLLKGKSARVIVTMDTPAWYYSLVFKKPGHNSMKKSILNFCGVNPVKITTFSPIKGSSVSKREQWLEKVKKLGEKTI